jgi:hypothetical protein
MSELHHGHSLMVTKDFLFYLKGGQGRCSECKSGVYSIACPVLRAVRKKQIHWVPTDENLKDGEIMTKRECGKCEMMMMHTEAN